MENKYNICIGVDLGLSGGLAYFDLEETEHESGGLLMIKEMPTKLVTNKSGREKTSLDIDQLYSLLEIPNLGKEKVIVVYEDVHSFGNGGFSMDVIMEQKGILRGLLKGFGYEPFPVSPKTWQKHFGIVPPKTLKSKEARKKYLKNNSRRVAQEKFPEFAHRFELKGSHGLSDSVLLAKWYLDIAPSI